METPHPIDVQKLIDKLYHIVHQLNGKINDAKQTAAYASTLGIDLEREAEHELFVYEERLAYTLMMIDTVDWVRGRKAHHISYVRELMTEHYKVIGNE
ncbi:hypothetical protein [Fibrella forsythiae]|uniref:Uncharacterized protein n=1 Tax=Fibrella forsythiae TaxID=2817061 RepID=A0ABS3JD08_9BACT|nr:hypothetical protein [Fibrella forsythiae]MBO0947326.1 hypothetical protein [Fibrella forsythiae]